MIKRIVKLEIKDDKIENFIALLKNNKNKILSYSGCNSLEFLQDFNNKNIFFTYSFWISENDLDNYRNSDYFKKIWSISKTYFSGKPQAWSLYEIK